MPIALQQKGSPMAIIQAHTKIFTAINVFTVRPERQQQLIDNLREFIDTYVKPLHGFLSASVHKSEDGVRVINYAQWKSREA